VTTRRMARGTAIGWGAVGPVCAACTVSFVWHAAAGIGLMTALTWTHYAGLAAAPIVALAVFASQRTHRRRLPTALVVVSMGALAVHTALHFAGHAAQHSPLFDLTNQAGILLLTAAVLTNAWYSRPRAVAG
jgi:hypothetical protein